MGLDCHDVGEGAKNLLYGMQESSWLSNFYQMLKDPSSNAASFLAPNEVVTVEPGLQVLQPILAA